jgi:hypothetical protein
MHHVYRAALWISLGVIVLGLSMFFGVWAVAAVVGGVGGAGGILYLANLSDHRRG